jgi:L-fucose isomerase-like protein
MKINLIPIYSFLHKKNQAVLKEDALFIDEINNYLMDEDLLIQENSKDAIFDVILIGSGGSEKLFLNMLKDLKEPIVILSTSRNNSLPACLEIKTYLENHNRLCFLLSGEEEHIANMLKHIATIINAYHVVMNSNLGLIGGPSSWLIASPVDNKAIYKNFKINIKKISMKELNDLIEETEKEMIDMKDVPHANELINKFDNRDTLHLAIVFYLALKKLVKKYNLKGLTIKCFDLLKKYKNTACLALALLNEEGIIAGCEGDVPSLITMHILYALTGRSSFMANPSKFNYEDHTLLLAHCTVPLNMCSSYSLDTHFESGLGIGVRGELPEGRITLCKVAPDYSLDNCVCIPANIKECPKLEGYCRTQVLVSLNDESLLDILKASFGNHLVISYGDAYQDFFPLLSLLRKE